MQGSKFAVQVFRQREISGTVYLAHLHYGLCQHRGGRHHLFWSLLPRPAGLLESQPCKALEQYLTERLELLKNRRQRPNRCLRILCRHFNCSDRSAIRAPSPNAEARYRQLLSSHSEPLHETQRCLPTIARHRIVNKSISHKP